MFLTGLWDSTARLWETATGREIARVAFDAGVIVLVMSGGAIALGDRLGRVHVFDCDAPLTAQESPRA